MALRLWAGRAGDFLPCVDGVEKVAHVPLAKLVGTADLAQAVAVARRTLADLDHHLVREDPLAGHVVTRRRLLAPCADLARNGELPAREGSSSA